MNDRHSEDVVFQTIMSCALAITADSLITALLYQLITVAVPLFESMLFSRLAALPQGAATGASTKTLAVILPTRTTRPPLAPFSLVTPERACTSTWSSPQTAPQGWNDRRPAAARFGIAGSSLAREPKRRGARQTPLVLSRQFSSASLMANSGTTSAIARCSTG